MRSGKSVLAITEEVCETCHQPIPAPGKPSAPEGRNGNAKCMRARFEGIETARKAELIFMPPGERLLPHQAVDLVTKTWKLPLPNFLLLADAGAVRCAASETPRPSPAHTPPRDLRRSTRLPS